MGRGVRLSVCPSVPCLNITREWQGRMEARHTSNQWTYELQIWHIDRGRRTASTRIAVTSKIEGQGRNVTWWVDTLVTERLRNTKIGRKVTHPTGKMRTSFQVKGQRSRSPGRVMLRPEVCHIFGLGKLMNFKLGIRRSTKTHITDKRRNLQGYRSWSQGHVMRLRGVSPLLENESPKNTKIGIKVAHHMCNKAHQF